MASTGSKTDILETALLQDIFQAAGNINALPASLYFALTTTVPTDSAAGTQTTYTGYARVAVARNGTNFTVSGNNVTNAIDIIFPTCTANAQTIRGIEIYTASSGGTRLYWTAMNVDELLAIGSAPIIQAGIFYLLSD